MRSVINSLAFAVGVYAQSTAYTDANTGIDFQRYADTTGVSFGIAVPETPASDFIGQMVRTMSLDPWIILLTKCVGVPHQRLRICRCFPGTSYDWKFAGGSMAK
jgi:hypothetical protein